jgi:hypothetical protein
VSSGRQDIVHGSAQNTDTSPATMKAKAPCQQLKKEIRRRLFYNGLTEPLAQSLYFLESPGV